MEITPTSCYNFKMHINTSSRRCMYLSPQEKAFTHFLWWPLPAFLAAFLCKAACTSPVQVETGICLISSTGCWYLGVDLTNRATMLITHINWCSFKRRFKFLPVTTLIKFHQWLLNDFNCAWFWRSIIQIDDLLSLQLQVPLWLPLCVLTVLLDLGSVESSILLS